MVNHKDEFSLDAAWVFTATGHDNEAGDGVGVILKSIARHVTVRNNIHLSNPYDF